MQAPARITATPSCIGVVAAQQGHQLVGAAACIKRTAETAEAPRLRRSLHLLDSTGDHFALRPKREFHRLAGL